MTRVKIAELKDNLSAYLRAVERGEEVEVTDRDRPIVRMIPIGNRPRITIRPPSKPFTSIRRKKYPPADWPEDSLAVLLEDRQKR